MATNRADPLVSVCLPTFNGERFLAEALESVIQQTYPHLEIIVSDDQSSDGTCAIVEDLQQRSPFPLTLHHHVRCGLAANWNFCIQQSHGPYVKLMGQDDLLDPDAVASLVGRALEDARIGMVFSPRRILVSPPEESANPEVRRYVDAITDVHKGWTNLKPVQSGAELLADPEVFHGCPNKIGEPVVVLMRRDLIDQLGGFNLKMRHWLDLDMWVRLMMVTHVGFIDRPLCSFRVHAGQATQTNRQDQTAVREHLQFYWELLASGGIERLDPKVREQVFWSLWSNEHGRRYRFTWPVLRYRLRRKFSRRPSIRR